MIGVGIIKNEIDAKETLGENLGKATKQKINKLTYWIVAVVIVGGLSSVYLFTRGFCKGWSKARIQNVNQF